MVEALADDMLSVLEENRDIIAKVEQIMGQQDVPATLKWLSLCNIYLDLPEESSIWELLVSWFGVPEQFDCAEAWCAAQTLEVTLKEQLDSSPLQHKEMA